MPTITEALAEVKLVKNKIEKKRGFVCANVGRQDGIKDPFAKEGGTAKLNAAEMQSIRDLGERLVLIRSRIFNANKMTNLEINGVTRSVADWLVWRREVAPMVKTFQQELTRGIAGVRKNALERGFTIAKTNEQATAPTDVIIEVDEAQLSKDAEALQELLDLLDGKLSLHNATTPVEV